MAKKQKNVGISVDIADGKVVVEFAKNIRYFMMTPQQAVELAEVITRKAMQIGGTSNIILPPKH